MIQPKLYINHLELKEALDLHRKNGKRLVFTNGCFDILHVGHVSYLEEARSLGDILVVAVNSDESVKKLKGSHRPIVNQGDRMKVLAALESVSYVTYFEEETPFDLISVLLPDVLVKGGEWQIDQIIGSDVVIAHGGEVKSLKFMEGSSTTNIEQKIILGYLARFSDSKQK